MYLTHKFHFFKILLELLQSVLHLNILLTLTAAVNNVALGFWSKMGFKPYMTTMFKEEN